MANEDERMLQELAWLSGQINRTRNGLPPTKFDPSSSTSRSAGYQSSNRGLRGSRGRGYRGGKYRGDGNYRGGSYSSDYGTYKGRGSAYRGRGSYSQGASSYRGGSSFRGSARGARGAFRGGLPYRAQPYQTQLPQSNIQCAIFTRTGLCDQGLSCLYKHDPQQRALCQKFVKGSCRTPTCALTHEIFPQNQIMCTYFAHGQCERADCQFGHMPNAKVSSPICPTFALNGWCDKGLQCTKRHVRECPDFDEKKICPRPNCFLPHIIKAEPRVAPNAAPKGSEAQEVSIDDLLGDLEDEEEAPREEELSAGSPTNFEQEEFYVNMDEKEAESNSETSQQEDGPPSTPGYIAL